MSRNNNISSIIGDYDIGPVLGIGTYGQVHFAQHLKNSSQSVAVKLIDASRLSAATRHSLNTEIKLQRRVNGNNCIKLIESFDSVELTGEWCSQCACNQYHRQNDSSTNTNNANVTSDDLLMQSSCSNCHHLSSDHSSSSSRPCLLLVQELGICGELFSLLQHTGPFSDSLARFYFRSLIHAIDECHSNDVIHRDLKPENIIFNHLGELKICDFGLASLRPTPKIINTQEEEIDDDFDYSNYFNNNNMQNNNNNNSSDNEHNPNINSNDDGTCVHHTGCGSQSYSAPEVYYREFHHYRPYKGSSADLWSAAVILYVMLVGRPPFIRPIAKSFNSVKRDKNFISLMKGEYPEIINKKAKTLLMKMFRIHPDDRLTIEEIQQDDWFNDCENNNLNKVEAGEEIFNRAKITWEKQGKFKIAELMKKQKQKENEKFPKTPNPSHTQNTQNANINNKNNNASNVNHQHQQSVRSLASNSRLSNIAPSNRSELSVDGDNRNIFNLGINPPVTTTQTAKTTKSKINTAATNTNTTTNNSISSTSRISPSGTYREFFRSARPPSTQSLSITAQNSLKPTSWQRQQSASDNDNDDFVQDDGDDDDNGDNDDDENENLEPDETGYENDDSSIDTEDKVSEPYEGSDENLNDKKVDEQKLNQLK